MGHSVFYEWKIEEVETKTGDILSVHHFDTTKEVIQWMQDTPADDGCHYDICLVRDTVSLPAGHDSTSPEADLVERDHFYILVNGAAHHEPVDEAGEIKDHKLPKYQQAEVNKLLDALTPEVTS